MTESTKSTNQPTTSRESSAQMSTVSGASTALASEQGKTTIADVVVSKIAGIATREVSGVHALGGGTARVVGSLRERIPGGRTNLSQGVGVEVGERQAAIDVDIVAEYSGIRQNVIAAVERMTGLDVTEVNITVHDVFLEDEDRGDETEAAPARVQ